MRQAAGTNGWPKLKCKRMILTLKVPINISGIVMRDDFSERHIRYMSVQLIQIKEKIKI